MESIDFKSEAWVLVQRGARSYIGRVHRKMNKIIAGTEEPVDLEAIKEKVFEIVANDGALRLNPCFEYFNSVVQNQGQIGRQPMALPFDITSGPVPLYVKVDTLMFLDEVEEQDQVGYKKLVETTMGFFTQARAERAGLVTSTRGSMPNNVRPMR
jgi:hypothetical protein